MNSILLLDVETSGLDPAVDHVIELGLVRWSVPHRSTIGSWSWLVQAPSNAAEKVNGIPAALLQYGRDVADHRAIIEKIAANKDVDAIVAHNGDFDRAWLPDLGKPWIDSAWDIDWPRAGTNRTLTGLALAHGLAVMDAHRALPDCQLLARLLERVGEMGHDVEAMLVRAMRPKVRVVSRLPYSLENVAATKAAGFRWEPSTKEWWRMIAADDVGSLPFPCDVDDGRAPPKRRAR